MNVSEGRDIARAARDRRRRAARHSSTCTPTPTTTARCSRSPGPGRTTRATAARDARRRGRRAHLDRRARRRAPALRRARRRAVRRARRHQGRTGAGGRRGARVRRSGGPRRTRCRCSSTTTPTPTRRDLPHIRRHAFRTAQPDFGPDAPHPTLGATAVGARKPLVAINCVLVDAATSRVARRIAREIRERDGGLPGVRALGFMLESQRRPQVSMNLVDLDRTGIEDACLARARARAPRAHRRRVGRGRRARPAARSRSVLRRVPAVGRHRRRVGAIEARIGHGPALAGPATRPAEPDGARRGSGAGEAAAHEGALAADAAAFPLGHPAPDPELLTVPQRVLEALGLDLAATADGLRLLGGRPSLGEEQVGIDSEAVGTLLPAAIGRSRRRAR